mmetsp:Transcript_4243/g.4924  ORF Transcript_4243/g.4924 Transcript_4243/m.4924 type:complete len:326 (+) Transcript_4243:215-1192(+)
MARLVSTCPKLYGRVRLLDGGVGEELFRLGLPDDRKTWSAAAIFQEKYHELLIQVHENFLVSGAQFVTTNNYAITPGSGFSRDQVVAGCELAAKLARQSVNKYVARTNLEETEICSRIKILGCLPPLVESYRADLILKYDDGKQWYNDIGKALNPHVDVFIAETMSCIDESKQALEGVAEFGKPLYCSWTLGADGQLRSGEDVTDAIRAVMGYKGLASVLFNCCEPEAVEKALFQIQQDKSLIAELLENNIEFGAYPNRLTAIDPDWTMEASTEAQPMRSDLSPVELWDHFISKWIREYNLTIVGGCCGVTPAHIAHFKNKMRVE